MAMLASKASYPGHNPAAGPSTSYTPNVANYRIQASSRDHHGFFASPTESEFSEHYDSTNSVRNWDEDRVGEWLRSIGCQQYVDLFKKNNINGENLMEMDQTHLKEMGIKKIGDRVRIGSQAKLFRNKEYKRASQRASNRESIALLEHPVFTPPSSASPKPLHSARSANSSRSAEKRLSRQIMGSEFNYAAHKSSSRPSSPFIDESRSQRSQRYGEPSPKKDPHSANSTSGKAPLTPSDALPPVSRFARSQRTPTETPQTARFNHHARSSPSQDLNLTNSSILPQDKALIRVIYPENARTSVVSIDGCKTAEDIILKTLRKGNLNEAHFKAYCFYVLEGVDPNPVLCRRLAENELVRICNDRRIERNRLILRKIHTGEPEDEQLRAAASMAAQQQLQTQNVYVPSSNRSQLKIEKITGESLAAVSYPLSPASAKERERHIFSAAQDLERTDSGRTTASARTRRIKELHGGRPPSELIASDLQTYFPDFEKDQIDKTVRMSIRRSRRISRATSRLSTASNFSYASSLKDAPPLPSISDAWLNGNGQQRTLRPLSVMRLGLPSSGNYRDSMASSVLEPLDEESPLEPDRKSYVSFGGESTLSITDPEGNTTMRSYYDDAGSSIAASEASDSLNKRLSQIVHEDSEESDEELIEYLEADSWENVKYMKGALIGQGSFGSVYLALHAVTGELMAVKQVEMPSNTGTALDAKKNTMVDALKHEIGLLRDLKHPNIVQYLGSNSDDTHLNIFLEYVPGGSVATMLVNYGPLGEGLISNFVRQILNGLSYLHSRDIIHRDIKGANILVDNKGSVKISDFGISKRVSATTLLSTPSSTGRGRAGGGGPRVSLQGSVFWMAPEVVKQTAYTRKADIWSLGCLIVEMFTGYHPHPNCTQLQAIFKIGGSGDASPTIPDNAGTEVREFLSRTFEIDHEKRPTAEELLGSPFCSMKA
ncbi:MAP kinase-like protein [Aulographum hederae CBS 113979]|uniref:mitogen-activated protein kinase n=1 Tax=Aulographum hederae CBS 113979 TaxID=1176131 RepID=A0A6G1HFC1_9PEZI|nr:MAP kinase-like protein [Aulographum hederae CBS 113979]